MEANEIAQRAVEIATAAKAEVKSYLVQERFADAKRVLTEGQRVLRDLKRHAAAHEHELRAAFQQERINVNKRGQFVGLVTSSETRARAARRRQVARRSLAQQQHDVVEPYRRVRTRIDDLVSSLAAAKSDVDWAKSHGRSALAMPPEWLPDPSGRHELRWWDGTCWTEHVADNGRVSVDPF